MKTKTERQKHILLTGLGSAVFVSLLKHPEGLTNYDFGGKKRSDLPKLRGRASLVLKSLEKEGLAYSKTEKTGKRLKIKYFVSYSGLVELLNSFLLERNLSLTKEEKETLEKIFSKTFEKVENGKVIVKTIWDFLPLPEKYYSNTKEYGSFLDTFLSMLSISSYIILQNYSFFKSLNEHKMKQVMNLVKNQLPYAKDETISLAIELTKLSQDTLRKLVELTYLKQILSQFDFLKNQLT